MMAPGWDVALFRAIHHGMHHPILDPVMKALTDPGVWKFPLFALAATLFLTRGRRGATALAALVLTVTVSDQATSRVLKPFFHRPRPSVALADTRPLLGVRHTWAFPSSHAMNFFAAAPLVAEAFPAAGPAYLVLAGAVAFSRVYVGDHWPSDVVVGALLGSCIGWLGRRALRRAGVTWERRAARAAGASTAAVSPAATSAVVPSMGAPPASGGGAGDPSAGP
jgi:undecaprenyl-diphosphatase